MGQMLRETQRAKGAKGTGSNQHKKVVQSPDDTAPTLAELRLTKRESAKAQRLAAIPKEDFQAIKAGEKTRVQWEIKVRKQAKKQALKVAVWPSGKAQLKLHS